MPTRRRHLLPPTRPGRNRSAPAWSIGPMAGPPTPKPPSSGATFPGLLPARNRSVSFSPLQDLHGIITPNGLFFERHHAGRPDIDPAQHKLMIHGLVERPLILTMKDILRFPPVTRDPFHRMPGQWRHGMARRADELAAVQARHDQLRRMDRRQAVDAAGRSRRQERGEVGDGRRRRRRAHEPQPAARQVSRRLPRGLRAKRRGAAARTGLSAAAGGAGLGRQRQHQMAAPDQARRQTLAFPRRNLEIHRPDAGRHFARLHLADRRQIRHHLSHARKSRSIAPASTRSGDWRGPATARSSASTSRSMAASIGRARGCTSRCCRRR